jgi:hypothetical protein
MNPPMAIQAATEGRFGFTLIPKSGVGLSPLKPVEGDAPQIWVEVDETPPTVRVDRTEVGRGNDQGRVFIYWTATDKQKLADTPISISYCKEKTGPWTPIPDATRIANTGRFDWKIPEGKDFPYLFYVRVEAIDMAKNVGQDIHPDPVKVDLKVPQVINITADPAPSVTPKP